MDNKPITILQQYIVHVPLQQSQGRTSMETLLRHRVQLIMPHLMRLWQVLITFINFQKDMKSIDVSENGGVESYTS